MKRLQQLNAERENFDSCPIQSEWTTRGEATDGVLLARLIGGLYVAYNNPN